MNNADMIICGDYVATMNERLDVIRHGAVAIKGKRIVSVGTEEDIKRSYHSKTVIDGNGKALIPGLINTHTHAAMVYFRGVADDLPLKVWLEEYMWPLEGLMLSDEFIYDAVELACLEMIKAGVTCYNDMYFFGESASEATIKAGIRALIGVGILDLPTVSAKTRDEYFNNAQRLIERYKGHELITPCIAPHALYTCGKDTLKDAQILAEQHGLPIHIHLSETEWEVGEILTRYGMRPAQYLDSIGFLTNNVIAAHCVWLDDAEIELMARHCTGVSHCIESNLKLASGFAPVHKMLKAGVRVTFGTDGAASNNDLNILGEMSTAAKVHKAVAKDPTVLDARTTLLMATRWGAEALGLGDATGSIETDKLADIVSINLRTPHLSPIYDIYSHIVYASMASDVETVIVDGKVLLENGYPVTIDEDDVLDKAEMWSLKIRGNINRA